MNGRALTVGLTLAMYGQPRPVLASAPTTAQPQPTQPQPSPTVEPQLDAQVQPPPAVEQPQPVPAVQAQPAAVEPQPAPAVEPQPLFEPAPVPASTPAPALEQPPAPTNTARPPSAAAKRVAGGALLGAGLTFATIGFVTFAGKAGQTEIGSQGLITFDPQGYALQPRIPRVVMGATFTVAGSVMAGLGGSMFARNGAVRDDPVATLARQRRVRTGGALLLGSGGATLLSGVFLLAFGGGEWASIPGVIDELRPEHLQSAHNSAAFFSWGAGLMSLGAGSLAAGLGLLAGNRQGLQLGASADASGGSFTLSGAF